MILENKTNERTIKKQIITNFFKSTSKYMAIKDFIIYKLLQVLKMW